MNKPLLMGIVIAVIAAAAGFGGGILYQKHSQPSRIASGRNGSFTANLPANIRQQLQSATTSQQRQQILQQAGLSGTFGGRGGGNLSGQVVAKDASSITIKTSDGNTHVIYYTSSTTVDKTTPASINDVSVGTQVSVGGSPNSDGSLSGRSIQIQPQS